MKRFFIMSGLFTILAGCASIEAKDVRNNAFYKANVTIKSDILDSSNFVEDVLKECYPLIGFSMSGGISSSLELYKHQDPTTGNIEYTMGNINYGGLLVLGLEQQNGTTVVLLAAKDNGWNEKFPLIVKSLETNSIEPCKNL